LGLIPNQTKTIYWTQREIEAQDCGWLKGLLRNSFNRAARPLQKLKLS
jgi:hypothetical protein